MAETGTCLLRNPCWERWRANKFVQPGSTTSTYPERMILRGAVHQRPWAPGRVWHAWRAVQVLRPTRSVNRGLTLETSHLVQNLPSGLHESEGSLLRNNFILGTSVGIHWGIESTAPDVPATACCVEPPTASRPATSTCQRPVREFVLRFVTTRTTAICRNRF